MREDIAILHPFEGDLTWQVKAACAEADPVLFFPEDVMYVWAEQNGVQNAGQARRTRGKIIQAAKAYCQDCPVRRDCENFAVEHDIRWGIWGGLEARERDNDRRKAS